MTTVTTTIIICLNSMDLKSIPEGSSYPWRSSYRRVTPQSRLHSNWLCRRSLFNDFCWRAIFMTFPVCRRWSVYHNSSDPDFTPWYLCHVCGAFLFYFLYHFIQIYLYTTNKYFFLPDCLYHYDHICYIYMLYIIVKIVAILPRNYSRFSNDA